MLPSLDDTIAAIASAPGGGLRGVIRISGMSTVPCVASCFRAERGKDLGALRFPTVVRGTLQADPTLGEVPCDVFLWPTNRSYTRQPAAELHLLGSPPILEAVLATICRAGARLAAAGEFTLRAFLAGRLDLTQAEAVLGVIDARSHRELDTALVQLAGGLAGPLHRLREQLLELLSHLEAGLDFVDEDIEFISRDSLRRELAAAQTTLAAIVDQIRQRGEIVAEPRVVLWGCPNVGKSSLLNALAGNDAAIVSDAAGTTRDYVTRRISLDGLSILLVDTAGIDELMPPNAIAAASQQRTRQQLAHATLDLLCLDASRPLNAWEQHELHQTGEAPQLVVLTKSDLAPSPLIIQDAILTSSRDGTGIHELRTAIRNQLLSEDQTILPHTAIRCRESLRLAGECLAQATAAAEHSLGDELVASELRQSLDELGIVVGAVYTDDILDRIFSRFCIGK